MIPADKFYIVMTDCESAMRTNNELWDAYFGGNSFIYHPEGTRESKLIPHGAEGAD